MPESPSLQGLNPDQREAVDAIVIAACVPRPVRFVMDHRIFAIPLLRFIFRTMRAIPIASAKEDPALKERAFVEAANARGVRSGFHQIRIRRRFLGNRATHEAMNLAGIHKMPVVFFCENNGYAEFSPAAAQHAATLEQRATSEGVDGPDVPSAAPDRFVVRAVFDNADGLLFPGAEARLKIVSRREAYAVRAWNVIWRWLRSVVW